MPATPAARSVELFAYPWDIIDRGADAFVEDCLRLSVTTVHAATLYHSGKFLLPRNRSHRVYFPEPGVLFVPLPKETFASGVTPMVSPMAGSGWLERLAQCASAAGIRLAAWTVFHHSSALGAQYPELTVRNLFGDSYPYALCPSHSAVREYSVALARGLASLGAFESLDLETIGYLGYFHGHHHEVTAIPAGPMEQFLLSLCFCEACVAVAEGAGIEIEPLRCELQTLLVEKMRRDDAAGRHAENFEQMATLLAVLPPLQRLIRLRLDTVTALVRQVRAAVGAKRLAVFTSSFVGSPSNIWMEGVSLADLREVADGFQLLAYTPDTDLVNADLVFCLAQVRDASRLNLTLNLGLPITPSLGHALAKIEFAWKLGVRRFSFFNYGFLGEGRLEWLREIAGALGRMEAGLR